jgi:hypothetical protein
MYDWLLEHYCILIIVDDVDIASWFLDLIVLVGCRHLLVPQNSRQP